MTNQEAIDIIKTAIAQVEWDYPMEYTAAFDMAVEALANGNNVNGNGWISVKDRMPDKDQEVLVLMDGEIIRVMSYRYDGDGMSWEDDYGYFNSDDRVSHWMSLPEPPKEG